MPPEAEKELNNDDVFAAAFEQISTEDNKNPTPDALVDKPTPGAPEAAAATVAAATEGGVVKTPEEIAAEAAQAAKTPEQIQQEADAAKAALESAEATARAIAAQQAEDARLARFAELVRPPAPAPAQQTPPPASPYTPEESAFLESVYKDFPDVVKAMQIERRAEYKAVVGHVFAQVEQAFNERVAPLAEQLATVAARMHLGDLQQAVPDYAPTREAVVQWAAKQPAWMQPALEHVIREGTVQEVAELIGAYKKDTGAATAQAAPAAQSKSAPTPAAAAAAAALAPVAAGKRSVATAAEPTAFDDAFAAFAKAS